jgi:ribose transport system permease protein
MSVSSTKHPSVQDGAPPDRGRVRTIYERVRQFENVSSVLALPVVTMLVVVIGGAATPTFFSGSNIRAILVAASLVGVVAVSMTPLTISGNLVSLSAGYSAMLGGMLFVFALNQGFNVFLAIGFVLASQLLIASVQGGLVSAGLNPIITTLAAGSIIYGFVAQLSHVGVVGISHYNIAWLGTSRPFGIPIQVIVFVLYALVIQVLSAKTVIGRQLSLNGANRAAAMLCGISYWRVTLVGFGVLATGVSIAGIMSAAQLGQSVSTDFPTLTFDVIAAVLIGGTSFQGGNGSPARSAFGAVLIALATNIMLLHGLSPGFQVLGEGALVIAMVIVLNFASVRSVR